MGNSAMTIERANRAASQTIDFPPTTPAPTHAQPARPDRRNKENFLHKHYENVKERLYRLFKRPRRSHSHLDRFVCAATIPCLKMKLRATHTAPRLLKDAPGRGDERDGLRSIIYIRTSERDGDSGTIRTHNRRYRPRERDGLTPLYTYRAVIPHRQLILSAVLNRRCPNYRKYRCWMSHWVYFLSQKAVFDYNF